MMQQQEKSPDTLIQRIQGGETPEAVKNDLTARGVPSDEVDALMNDVNQRLPYAV